MNNNATLVDISTWARKNHFQFYKDFADPYFNITSQIDVSNLIKFCRQNESSIFLTLLYLCSLTANQITAFRLRIDNQQQVWQYKTVAPSATLLTKEQTFTFCHFDFNSNYQDFLKQAESQKQQALTKEPLTEFCLSPARIYYSVIPWLSFTSYKHAQDLSNDAGVPKIVMGKVTKVSEQEYQMPISVELHHALADGLDLANFIKALEENIDSLAINYK